MWHHHGMAAVVVLVVWIGLLGVVISAASRS